MKTSHKNIPRRTQDLEVRDGQEPLWTSRLGSFNSFLKMQVLGRWDIFSCKHLSSFAHCKRVYASKQGDFLKTPTGFFEALNANGKHEISKRDRLGQKGFQLSKKFGWLNPVNSWREQHRKPLEELRFDRGKFSFRPWFIRSACHISIHFTIEFRFCLFCVVLAIHSLVVNSDGRIFRE